MNKYVPSLKFPVRKRIEREEKRRMQARNKKIFQKNVEKLFADHLPDLLLQNLIPFPLSPSALLAFISYYLDMHDDITYSRSKQK